MNCIFLAFLIFILITSKELDEEKPYEVYVKQSGDDNKTGTAIGQEKKSLKRTYDLLGNDEKCTVNIVNDILPLAAERISIYKRKRITFEGINSDGNGNSIVHIDCNVHAEYNLFECSGIIDFKYLAFHFPVSFPEKNGSSISCYSIFRGGTGTYLRFLFCQLIRPLTNEEYLYYNLVQMGGGCLEMINVECADNDSTVIFSDSPFEIHADGYAYFTNVTLKKITSKRFGVVFIDGSDQIKTNVLLEGTNFTECESYENGIFNFHSAHRESTFSIGDGGVTSFTSCSSNSYNAKSGGIYLSMPNIKSASQLYWPHDGRNLILKNCFQAGDVSKRKCGLYLYLSNDLLYKEVADEMKVSFAANYTRIDNRWDIVGYSNEKKDKFYFTGLFFDPPPSKPDNMTRAFVKNEGKGNGIDVNSPIDSIYDAYEYLEKSGPCFIDIINAVEPIKAEEITFDVRNGITIEGMNENGEENTEVAVDCDVKIEGNLFTCDGDTEFKYLVLHFPTTLGFIWQREYILIYGSEKKLSIINCKFIRPAVYGTIVDIRLVLSFSENFIMNNVECVDNNNTVTFEHNVFEILYPKTVLLTNVTLNKISSKNENILCIEDDSSCSLDYDRMDITLNASVFAECQTGYAGTLNVKSCNSESTFTVGDGGVSSFTSCSCTNGNSGGIYLAMPNIQSAPQLKWPKDGKNLVFQNCSVTFSDSKKNTGLCICVNDYTLYKDIAESMKTSFAANYTRLDNRWNVLGYDREIDQFFDFTTLFFDAPPQIPENMERAFVKNGGEGNGINVEFAINSIYDAYYYLEKSGKCFIDIVKTLDAIKAEEIKFSTYYGVSIEGVNDNGKGNTEVAINCDVSVSSILFSCQETVEFQYLAFQFSSTEKNWESLISAGSGSISLKISTCRFVRIGSQSQEGMNSNADGDNPLASSLVSVTFGSVEMDTVKCTDETSFVTFSSSPFSFSGAREVSLGNVEISKVNVQNGAAISIRDESDSSSKVSIEGLNVREVKSEKGAAAGLDITLSSEESRVAIGRSSKCSFKSCSAPEGKSGAIFIDMPKAASNLQLPSEHNLEIDSSNTAGSKTTSLFIIAPDFEKFCKQEDAFLFANDYDDSTVGWIEGAIDEESEPEDVYEKNIKGKKKKPIDNPEKDQTKDKKKTSTGVIAIAIVVPIVVVVAVVVIVIVIVVVRKKRSKNEENDEKEQEMKD